MPFSVDLDVEVSKDASSAIRKAQRKRLKEGMQKGFAVSREHVPQDRGTLLQSGVEPEWQADGSIAWKYTANHALPIETGTAPFQPPIQPLLEWSKRVTGDEGLGWYVATQKIPEEGIDEQPYARPGIEATKRWLKSNGFDSYLDDELR